MSSAPDLPVRMRAAVQDAPGELRLEERPIPQPGPGEILVRVRAAGICGSDLHFWKYAVYGAGAILGHEIAGEVAALGEGVDRLRPGQLGVVYAGIPCGCCPQCRGGLPHYCDGGSSLGTGGPFGGLGEYLFTPADNFLAAPEESDPALLTWSEPLANGIRCLDHPEVREAGSALVFGGGPIGLSCLVAAQIDWRPGDEVLCFGGDYRSVVHAFQGMAHRGVEVRVTPPEEGRVTPELVASQLRERTRVVALSWVRYDNGARADLEAIGGLLADAGVLFVVDGIQGAGVLPIDVRAARIGFLAAGAHKWLLGVSGAGILYVRRELLPSLVQTHLGVTSMEDAEVLHCTGDAYRVCPVPAARQVEEGARNALGIAALGASLELLARIGAEAVASQVKAVTDRLCEGFLAAGGRVRSPRGEGEWSGILLLEPPPAVKPQDLWARLLSERVLVGMREGALWGGAHYYNDLDDAERLLSFL